MEPLRRTWLVASVTTLCASPVFAADILQTDIAHDNGRYTVHFDVRLAGRTDTLKRHLTDYDEYAKSFSSIRESTVLERRSATDVRLRVQVYGCVLFFCRTLTAVKDLKEDPNDVITATFVPMAGSFREGHERWRILPDGDNTRLLYDAELVPNFYVPPLIGPWLIKRQLRNVLIDGATKLEERARG